MSESEKTIEKRLYKSQNLIEQTVTLPNELPKYEHGIVVEGDESNGIDDPDTAYYIYHKLDRHNDHNYKVIKQAKIRDLEVTDIEYMDDVDPHSTDEDMIEYLNREIELLLTEEWMRFRKFKDEDNLLKIVGRSGDLGTVTVTISGWNKSSKREPETTLNQFV